MTSLCPGIPPLLSSSLTPIRLWSQFNQPPSGDELQILKNLAQAAQDLGAGAEQNEARRNCFEELTSILRGPYVDRALQTLLETGILDLLLPEVAQTSRMGPLAGSAYKDVWEHTKTVVWQSVPRASVRWAALLHDVGKVSTVQIDVGGRVSFMDHERVSYELFEHRIRGRLAFPKRLGDRIGSLILNHQRPSQYESDWSDAAVRRFDREMGELVEELLLLSRADITSRRPGRRKARLAAISELARRIRELRAQAARDEKIPKGLGQAILQTMDLPPGPWVGQVRSKIVQAIAQGELEPTMQPEDYVEYARAQGWLCLSELPSKSSLRIV